MPREARFDVLFEPVKIGPLTAKNRFFQVPHCNGMGYAKPRAHAEMRGVKAEGGWAVVSTEEVEIPPSSDLSPYIEGRLWDDADIPFLAMMTEAVRRHGFGGLDRRLPGAESDRRRFSMCCATTCCRPSAWRARISIGRASRSRSRRTAEGNAEGRGRLEQVLGLQHACDIQ